MGGAAQEDGLRLRKSVYAQEQESPQLQQQGQAFRQRVGDIEDWQWVFVDETWFNTQMSRYWGWAEPGVRVPEGCNYRVIT